MKTARNANTGETPCGPPWGTPSGAWGDGHGTHLPAPANRPPAPIATRPSRVVSRTPRPSDPLIGGGGAVRTRRSHGPPGPPWSRVPEVEKWSPWPAWPPTHRRELHRASIARAVRFGHVRPHPDSPAVHRSRPPEFARIRAGSVRDAEAAGSNPAFPTIRRPARRRRPEFLADGQPCVGARLEVSWTGRPAVTATGSADAKSGRSWPNSKRCAPLGSTMASL